MITFTQQRKTRAANNERREADFRLWEAEARRRDEITDQSERLASPMQNSFEYTLTPDGDLVTDLGEPMRPVFETGYQAAKMQAAWDSRWVFEANRRGIELEELGEIEDYARDLGEGVRMTSISLDGSDYEGMQAIARKLGFELPAERPGSEEILQSRMWTPEGLVVLSPVPDAVRVDGIDIGAYDKHRLKLLVRIATPLSDTQGHTTLVDLIRTTYDDVLTARTGEKHYAGRAQMSNEDAKTFIEKQPDLIDAHMEIVNKIFALTNDKEGRNKLLAPHRYNFAAALDDRLHGRMVSDLSSSGDNARAEGKTFDGDCPTSESAQSATDQAGRLGYQTERWSKGVCRNCERETQVWKVEDGGCSVCSGCARAHTLYGQRGLDTKRAEAAAEREREIRQQRARATAKKIGASAAKKTISSPKEPRHGDIVMVEQIAVRYEERIAVGGTVGEYVDIQTGRRLEP